MSALDKITEETPLERCILITAAHMSQDVAERAAAEFLQLRARLELVQGAVRKARGQLRATQRNWDEDCLFRCDEFLTAALDNKCICKLPGFDVNDPKICPTCKREHR